MRVPLVFVVTLSCWWRCELWSQALSSAGGTLPVLYESGEMDTSGSELRTFIERFDSDFGSVDRSTPVRFSPRRIARMKDLQNEWLARLRRFDFDALSQSGRIDYILMENYLTHELKQREVQQRSIEQIDPLIPFMGKIVELDERRRQMEPVKAKEAASILDALGKQVDSLRKSLEMRVGSDTKSGGGLMKKTLVNRAAGIVSLMRTTLKSWFGFYNGYDPAFTWWVNEPYKKVDKVLEEYGVFLREKIVGVKSDDDKAIIGDPIGREVLLGELAFEMIPYTPEELVVIANQEFSWCESEMKRASRDLGYGDDWRRALEYVKTLYVEPGKQPEIVRDLAREAIAFVDKHDLVTVPQLARDTWRMGMLSPEQQAQSPFFLGGEMIQVAFPTNTMDHEQKMMSMRGNNVHFARATVFHELIPGHHLQGFMMDRYRAYRSLFNTPFWVEGGALYWEMLFWDLGFPKTAENRIGMLFWRMHRCARIIFSLSFHLEKMTPQHCIDFLVERVGHERENATAEVRRSVIGGYGPLYQCAYMIGGLQIRALRKELVDSGKVTDRQFHDAILHENSIPIEMVRASLTGQQLSRSFTSSWKFYGPVSEKR